jgi:hypothetical protein
MHKFPIRFLISLSAASLSGSCNQYRHMQRIQTDVSCIQKFKPDFRQVIYKTSADITGKHLSGLLVIKYMPDSSTRIVFSNEMGISLFDFEFPPGNGFSVYQIVPQMDKKPVIKTLRKDFELIMFRNLDTLNSFTLTDNLLVYHAFPQTNGVNYYITDTNCRRLVKMQRASNKKPVMEAFLSGGSRGTSPDSILIRHLNFDFTISLQKITPIASR